MREIALQAKSLGETIAAISERGAERPPSGAAPARTEFPGG